MRALVAVLAVGVAVAIPVEADATCAEAQDLVSPASGSVVPPNPVLYVFWVVEYDLQQVGDDPLNIRRVERTRPDVAMFAKVDGHSLRLAPTIVFDGPAYRVVEVRVPIATGSFRLRYAPGIPDAEYSVSNDLKPSTVVATGVAWDVSSWTCSHTDAIDVAVDGRPAAFLATWPDGNSAVLPPSTWNVDSGHSRVELGYVDCVGLTIPRQYMSGRARAHISLFALHADGSKTAIDLQHVIPSAWLEDDSARAVTSPPSRPSDTRWSASLLLLAAAAVLLHVWQLRSAPS